MAFIPFLATFGPEKSWIIQLSMASVYILSKSYHFFSPLAINIKIITDAILLFPTTLLIPAAFLHYFPSQPGHFSPVPLLQPPIWSQHILVLPYNPCSTQSGLPQNLNLFLTSLSLKMCMSVHHPQNNVQTLRCCTRAQWIPARFPELCHPGVFRSNFPWSVSTSLCLRAFYDGLNLCFPPAWSANVLKD